MRRLLSKDPDERANCDDILKNVWKVQVSGKGFKNARNRLKQMVIKRKIGQRASYDDTNIAMYQDEIKRNTRATGSSSKHNNRRKRKQHGHPKTKKGRDHNILECMAPMNYRDSFVVAEMKEQDEHHTKRHGRPSLSSSHRKIGYDDDEEDKKSDRHRQRTFAL